MVFRDLDGSDGGVFVGSNGDCVDDLVVGGIGECLVGWVDDDALGLAKWTIFVLVGRTCVDRVGVTVGVTGLMVVEDLVTFVFEIKGVGGAVGVVVGGVFFKDWLDDAVGLGGCTCLVGGCVFEEGVGITSGFGSRWGSAGDGWSYLEFKEQ